MVNDNRLTELYPDYHLDYGIDFINYAEADEAKRNGTFNEDNYWSRPDPMKDIKLFKFNLPIP